MKTVIIGSGTVGGAIGTAFSLNGHDVLFYDVVQKQLPIQASFTKQFDQAFSFGDIFIVCVPTEPTEEGKCDLSIFRSVCQQFAEHLQNTDRKRILVQKSTCPPGTASIITDWLKEDYGVQNGVEYEYVVNPSFLNMGNPIKDEILQRKCLIGLRKPDSADNWARVQMKNLYCWTEPLFESYIAVELAKYANNIMHAGILSMWNEIFLLGNVLGVDTDWVAKVTTLEPGLETVYRVHGMAWGGVCLPKDTQALLLFAKDLGLDMHLLEAIISVNDVMKEKYGVRTQHWNELHPSGPVDPNFFQSGKVK